MLFKTFSFLIILFIISACASTGSQQASPLKAMDQLADLRTDRSNSDFDEKVYTARTWVSARQLKQDPIDLANASETPIHHAQTKILSPSDQDAVRSLAAKVWMIENAQYSVDLSYYIFKGDLVGYALLGALCNAVKRGVDIRIMVDSVGSLGATHNELKAVETCAEQAGFIRDVDGTETANRARVQVVIINALTSMQSWSNRRSHDKLLIVDGSYPGKDIVMMGGRNISLDYYGINEDGSKNSKSYRDLEIVLRSDELTTPDELTVGEISSAYYTLLFLHKGNKRIYPTPKPDSTHPVLGKDPYKYERDEAQRSLTSLKKIPEINRLLAEMPVYMTEDFNDSKIRLAHQLGNLTSSNVITKAVKNRSQNVNSIGGIFAEVFAYAEEEDQLFGSIYIVSPYLFLGRHVDEEGNINDGAGEILRLIEEHPDFNLEIITNSVLTSDNFFTQTVIDMDLAPNLLLTPELQKIWRSPLEDGELNPELVESEQWKKLINNPRIKIYQTGMLDSAQLGGETYYGKLHAKFVFWQTGGFVTTSNFDNRSRFFNNEMGFFYKDPELSEELLASYELLKSMSYRWGSPEWLQMRKELMDTYSRKGNTTRSQRERFNLMRMTGFEWLI